MSLIKKPRKNSIISKARYYVVLLPVLWFLWYNNQAEFEYLMDQQQQPQNSRSLVGQSSSSSFSTNDNNIPPPLLQNQRIKQYIQMHKNSLEKRSTASQISEGIVENDDEFTVKKNSPLLIWSNRKPYENGGIGDRINGIFGAFMLAVCTNRIFLIEYTDPVDIRQVLQVPQSSSSAIRWDAKFQEEDVDQLRIRMKNNPDHEINQNPLLLSTSSQHYNATGYRLSTNNYTRILDSAESSCARDFFSGYPDGFGTQAYHDLFYTLFEFTPQVTQRANGLVPRLPAGEDGNNDDDYYIAAHVRTGDAYFAKREKGTKKTNERHSGEQVPMEFLSCAQMVRTRMLKGNNKSKGRRRRRSNKFQASNAAAAVPIYVASDDDQTKSKMKQLNPETVVVAQDLTLFHIDRYDNALSQDAKLQGHLDAWAELVVLINSTCLVGSKSGYSDLAIALSPKQSPRHRCALRFWECHDNDAVHRALENFELLLLSQRR